MNRGVWSPDTIAWVIVASLLPTLSILLIQGGIEVAVRIVLGLGVVGVWQLVFAAVRGQPVYPASFVPAFAVAVLAPGDLALWQLVLGLTFGAVMGELIFGGWGRNVLSASVVTLAFLYFSFPEVLHAPAGAAIALASLPAAVGLLLAGILSWRVMTGAVATLVAVTLLFRADPLDLVYQGSLAFGVVYLIGDPVTSASTNAGRWIYGALGGGLAGIFGWAGAGIGAPETIVFAALVASIFAPLIDEAVIALHCRARESRHG